MRNFDPTKNKSHCVMLCRKIMQYYYKRGVKWVRAWPEPMGKKESGSDVYWQIKSNIKFTGM